MNFWNTRLDLRLLRNILDLAQNSNQKGRKQCQYRKARQSKEDGDQVLVFTRSVLKQGDPNPPEFQTAIMESQILYGQFCRNPGRFLN